MLHQQYNIWRDSDAGKRAGHCKTKPSNKRKTSKACLKYSTQDPRLFAREQGQKCFAVCEANSRHGLRVPAKGNRLEKYVLWVFAHALASMKCHSIRQTTM